MKNRFFKKKTPNFFKKVEITRENHRFSALSDPFCRKPHKEIISMRSFSTWPFGLRGRTRSIFSKRVVRDFRNPKTKNPKMVGNGRQAAILTIYYCKIRPRRSRNVTNFEAQNPKEK